MSSRTLSSSLELSAAKRSSPEARASAPYRPVPAGAWRYQAPRRARRMFWSAAAVAAGVHVVGLFAFNFRAKPARAAAPEEVIEVRLALPEMPLEPEEQPIEVTEVAEAAGALPVPTLIDIPTTVSIDSFVQTADFRPQMKLDFNAAQLVNIPLQFGTGAGNGANGLSNVFSLSDLDRIPEAIVQTPPVFPFDQKRQGIDRAEVIVAFVVDAEGRVRDLQVERSSNRDFEQAALSGVAKWKFRPGMKGGRKVATRMRVPLRFALEDAEV